jgi:hypothetical protein
VNRRIASAASRASHSSFAGSRRKDGLSAALDLGPHVWIPNGAGLDEVDRSPKQLLQPFLEAEIGFERAEPPAGLVLDQKIEVAPRR